MARGPNRRRVDRVPGERRRLAGRALRLAAPAVLAVTALATLGWLGWRVGVEGPLLRVQAIRITGASRTVPEDLLASLPLRLGDHLLSVDPEAVEAAARRQPWVGRVQVRRKLPAAVEITVTERHPAALVSLGELYLVDDGGEVFKRALPGDGLDLPLVTGLGREAWLERRAEVEPLITGALALARAWADHGLGARLPISEIHVDADFGTTVWTADGTEVRLGQKELEAKLARLERLIPALDAEVRRPEVIHLDNRRHPDWVAVRFAGAGS
ncbi:MAG: FtsQ-type POTRA domain-containing protein [Anaeromyxobacter sp.]